MNVPPRRLLVRGVNWLGDAVMTTPALRRLRERFPEADITLLTHEKLADLWRRHPSLNGILTFGRDDGAWSVARRLREKAFDLALVLPNSPRSALEVWLARIPQRVGYARPWRNWLLSRPVSPRPGYVKMDKLSSREVRRLIHLPPGHESRFTNHVSRLTPAAHQTYEYLHLAAALGASSDPLPPELSVVAEESDAAALKFGLAGESSRISPASAAQVSSSGGALSALGKRGTKGEVPILGLNPGAEYGPAKRWPPERFIAVAREIQQRTGCVWLIFGGKGDAPLAGNIHAALAGPGSAALNLAGKTSLRELMALLKVCRVLLTNDTGPMHIAAALGTPVVAPFGSTSLQLTGPGLPGDARHHLLNAGAPCSPCFRRTCPIDFRCMTGITVEAAVAAIQEALKEENRP
jgi:heptosyltransferase-2